MATMKYIGARYMPKFMGTYDATTAYEALSVVDNGAGTTYVANKPVPVGTPLTDSDYWTVYGASSGAILDLQTRMGTAENAISALQGAMTTAQGDITTLQKDVGLLKDKKYILIGDSYVNYPSPTTGYAKYLKDYTGLVEDTNIFTRGVAGSSFHDTTYSFTACLQGIASRIDNKNEITDIIVVGGINDRNASQADITAGIVDFVTYAHTTYPNAKIHLACVGWHRQDGQTSAYFLNAVRVYKICAGAYQHLDYITDSEYIFNDYSLLDVDLGHPLEAGAKLIARGLANWFKNGLVRTERSRITSTFAHNTALLNSGDMNIWEFNEGDHVSVNFGLTVFEFTNAQAAGTLKLGSLSAPHFIWGDLTFCTFLMPCTLTLSDNSKTIVPLEFYISNGDLYVILTVANTKQIACHRNATSFPKTAC